MPNPVVSFEVRGPDPGRLREFYSKVFEWDIFVFPGGTYAGVETTRHAHNDAAGTITYDGADAYMNDGVIVGSSEGQPAWKYPGESRWHSFQHGTEGGGIGEGDAAVMFYIQVPELEAALAAVTREGGAVVLPPTNVAPEVFIATFSDPAGNVVGLTRAPAPAD